MAGRLSLHSVSAPFAELDEQSKVVRRDSFKKIADRFLLGNQIGEGGMSVVYNAMDLETGNMVAVKQMRKRNRKYPSCWENQIKTAVSEVAALLRLEHKGIVQMVEAVFEGGIPHIVLEKLEPLSLRDAMEHPKIKEQLRSVRKCLEMSSDLCSAIAHMHSQDVIHRDIKPGNIFITAEGPKLFDFGLAKSPGGFDPKEEDPEIIIGSIPYMSPEQAGSGNPIGPHSDLYSLGATMHWMFSSGKPLFDARNDMVFLYCHRHEVPKPVNSINPEVPDSVAAVVEKALQKDPKDRFSSAVDMKKAIDGCLQSLPVSWH